MFLVLIFNLFLLSLFSEYSFLESIQAKPLGFGRVDCVKEVKEFTVRGSSMTDLINQGEKVKILFGFYDCNEIRREDVVAYDYKGNSNLIIKSVKGLPGDNFKINEKDGLLVINDIAVLNNQGESYFLDDQDKKMLKLYERDYRGKIPPETYLILGNLASGSTDSTRFGLVGRKELVGEVVKF